MKNLLLTGALKLNKKQFTQLEEIGYHITFVQEERQKLKIDVSGFHAVVCNGLFLHNDIKEFKSLELIQLTSAGYDRVPVEYIQEKGIRLFNAKGVYSIPMAEWVVLKILEIYKKSRVFYKNQERHQWEKHRDLLELTGKTAVIIGFGNVGEEVAKRLKAFDVKIIGVGRRMIQSDLLDEFHLIQDIEEVLNKGDIIILTLPLTDETRGLIDQRILSVINCHAVLVNVSRGGIIQEKALIDALKEGKFKGVALDVFQEEPLKESPLWDFENVIVTPHNSFVSDKVRERLFDVVVGNLKKNLG